MPIRFRCAYCNQLMGISTRKAGTVVRCPKCAGEIIVPMPEGMHPPEERADQAAGPQAFEDQNFEQVFSPPANGTAAAAPEAPSAPVPMGALSSAELTMAGPTAPPKRAGLFLPLPMLIISLVVIVLLFILVFVLGLIIGRQTGVVPEAKATDVGALPRLAVAHPLPSAPY